MDATESADLYAATRARVTETAQALTAEQLNTRVPACPDWTEHNLISHLAGVADDFVAGNLDDAPRPPWTAVQVKARQDLPRRRDPVGVGGDRTDVGEADPDRHHDPPAGVPPVCGRRYPRG